MPRSRSGRPRSVPPNPASGLAPAAARRHGSQFSCERDDASSKADGEEEREEDAAAEGIIHA